MDKFLELVNTNSLFDSHCHLNSTEFDEDLNEVISRAKESNVENIFNVAYDLKSSEKSLSQKNESIFPTAGIHPEFLIPGSDLFNPDFNTQEEMSKISEFAKNNKEVLAIGECGLDYYWLEKKEDLTSDQKEEIKNKQRELFKKHLELGRTLNLPVIIHSRGVVNEAIKLGLESNATCIFHSLTNDSEDANEFEKQVDEILGNKQFIGINGIITYSSANMLREVLKKRIGTIKNPIELYEKYFLLETDSPYLAPRNFIPLKSRRNEPAAIAKTWEFLKSL